MARNPYWSPEAADMVLLNVDNAIARDDFYFLTWDLSLGADFDARATDTVVLGAYDSLDFVMIYLQEDVLYDFGALSDDWHPEISIYDLDGWLLRFDDPDDGLFTIPDDYGQDSIIGFVPDYSGYYFLDVGWEFQDDSPGLITFAALGYGHAFEPQILDDDGLYWDAAIVTAQGDFVAPDAAQLYRAYMGALGREPDWGGFQWWSNQIADGYHDLWSMAAGFISSAEFQGLADRNYDGWVDDAEFVDHMYVGVFGREADWHGFEFWINELQSGNRDRVDVFVDMTQSNEYVELTLLAVADQLFYA